MDETRKKWIVEFVCPILEDAVTDCIGNEPADPVLFMLEWMEKRRAQSEDDALTPSEMQRLLQENTALTNNIEELKRTPVQKPVEENAVSTNNTEELKQRIEKPKEEDAVPANTTEELKKPLEKPVAEDTALAKNTEELKEPTETPKKPKKAKSARSVEFQEDQLPGSQTNQNEKEKGEVPASVNETVVEKDLGKTSAKADGEISKDEFVPTVIEKTRKQKERLQDVLGKTFLFSNLDDKSSSIIIDAMSRQKVTDGEVIFEQGDRGEFLYVVDYGKLPCVMTKPDGTVKTVKVCELGDVFGELALFYDCPRAATVKADGACILWRLDRNTFNHIVKPAARQKRESYDEFLSNAPFLISMHPYERSLIADAVKTENFADGAEIILQGEIGERFYILGEGEAVAIKDGVEGLRYLPGDYFGELTLIKNQPRAATVACKGKATVLYFDAKSFKRLFNAKDLLSRAEQYDRVISPRWSPESNQSSNS